MKLKVWILPERWPTITENLNTIDIVLLAKIVSLEFYCLLCRTKLIWKTFCVVCFDKIKLLETTYTKYWRMYKKFEVREAWQQIK